jgi:CMP-N,N'-diacetyllegionaminic acid synthase
MSKEGLPKKGVLGLIPTRGGSKGLENKNVKLLEGKPLIAHTIEAAQHCADITKVLVTTDNANIAAVAKEFGAEVYRHPAELSEDGKATFPVIQYVVRDLVTSGEMFELVTSMRATSPLRTPEDITNAINLLLETNADSVVSVTADQTGHPIRLKTLDHDLRISNLEMGEEDSPVIRQNLPIVYRRNGAIYVTKTPVVLGGSLFGKDSRGYVMPKSRSVNINDEVDFICAAAILRAKERGEIKE